MLVGGRFVHPDRFTIQADLVHDPCRVVGVFFRGEFDEAITLVGLCHAVLGEVHVGYSAGLEEEFPDERVSDALVKVADVNRGVFVLFPAKDC